MLTSSRLKSSINRIIGRFLTNRGYQITRSERIAGDKLNLLELGFALISSQVDGPLLYKSEPMTVRMMTRFAA